MIEVLIGYSACPLTAQAFESVPGIRATTCDLLPSRGWHRHLQCDVREAIGSKRWDYGLFHPMCTVLTTSGAWAFADPDFDRYPGVGYHQRVKPGTLTGKARRDQREIELENFRWLLSLPFPADNENPAVSFINTAIRPPTEVIHPYQFGDDASKATGLWHNDAAIREGMPTLRHTAYVTPRLVRGKGKVLPRWSNQTDSGQNKLTPGNDRWLLRSQTYPGIAHAIGTQRGRWLSERG